MSPDDFDAVGGEKSSNIADKIAALEDDLQAEKDGRNEDRFFALLIIFVFLDAFLFAVIENATAPIAILILELIALILIARRLGIEQVEQIIDRILSAVTRDK